MHRLAILLFLFSAACATVPPATAPDSSAATLETTPRHHEWVTIPSAGRTLHAYVAWPERSDAAPAVLVIHENRGLNDWARTVADQLASRGYLAIAPDMLSGTGPGGGRTDSFPNEDAAREGISKLDMTRVVEDMRNAALHSIAEAFIIHQDVGRLAAQFLRDALHRRGGSFGNFDARARRSGEAHHVDIGMRGNRSAHRGSIAVHEIEDAFRNARSVKDFGPQPC